MPPARPNHTLFVPDRKPFEPSIGIVFSKIKTGKTADLLYAFGEDCVFVARPGALSSTIGLVGRELPANRIRRATGLDTITHVLGKVAGKVRAVVVDDLTPIAAEHVRDYVYKRNGKPRLKGWKLWGRVREDMLNLRSAAAQATEKGTHVWFTAHERQPRVNPRKGFILGGPDLPGSMQEDFSAICDYVLRAKYAPGRYGWPYEYHGGPSSTWGLGDRFNVVGKAAPMNITEIMRAAGFDMPRGKGREGLEARVEDLCGALVESWTDGARVRAKLKETAGILVQSLTIADARWVLRDGVDRAALRARAGIDQLSGFWVEAEADAAPGETAASGDGLSDEVEGEVEELDEGGGEAAPAAGAESLDAAPSASTDDAEALE